MGRTKRKRKNTNKNTLPCDILIINLQKWLSKNHWKNESKLKIKSFVETGRGITSEKSIRPNDILISMPTNLMITFRSLKFEFPIKDKLTMQELLAFFLIIEKMKGVNSKWCEYIQSLPEDIPPLPWLALKGEINVFPADLRLVTERSAANFKTFLNKVKTFIEDTNCILEDRLCRWAYAMVNTRAVYVNPNLISDESSSDLLLDKPSMALCPFLDMFNHHFLANTEASLVEDRGELIYQLRSLTGFKKRKQIFISYGQHDNIKLLTEYGFFVPGNIYDTVKFEFEDVLRVLDFNLDQNRYKFIREHNFQENLHLGYDGVSYNLKIVLFVGFSEEFRHLDSIVFSDSYPKDFLDYHLPKYVENLLNFKSAIFTSELMLLTSGKIISEGAKNVVEFVKYRIRFLEEIKTVFC